MSTPKKALPKETLKLIKQQIKSEKEEESPKEFDIKKAAELMAKGQK